MSGAAQGPTLQNGSIGAAGASLDPSAAAFQPMNGSLSGGAPGADPASVATPIGFGPVTTRQGYEALLDPSYIADCQWERDEQQKEKDELQKERDELLQMVE